MNSRGLAMLCGLLVLVPAISAAQPAQPLLSVTEASFGTWEFQGSDTPAIILPVPANSPLEFSWLADASAYEGAIDAYRYGWDVIDPDDPDDPGWATAWLPDLLSAPPQSFQTGLHSLHVLVRDTVGAETRAVFWLDIQPEIRTAPGTWGKIKASYTR